MADEQVAVEQAVEVAAEVIAQDAGVKAEEVAEQAKSTVQKIETEIEAWFSDVRRNLTMLDTEAHNKLHACKEALKARLANIL